MGSPSRSIVQTVPRVELAGQRFGRWTAVERAGVKDRSVWLCQCDCGTTKPIPRSNLTRGASKSCGCWRREETARRHTRHGDTGSPEYEAWAGMTKRCTNTKTKGYADYGGRGIKVCARWRRYENFLADMGRKPSPKHSLDRIDVNGDYEPENCRWATSLQQVKNRRPRRRSADRISINEILAAHGLVF